MAETTAAGALADTSKLSDFEGLSVRQVGIEIPGAAGGLRDPLRIDPQEWHKGERLFVVFELQVSKVRFDSIDRDDPAGDQRRVHITDVIGSAIVDRELVSEALAEQKRRVDAAEEAAKGIGHLQLDGGEEAQKAHDDGLHAAGLVPGCPGCEAEAAALEAEAADAAKADTPTDDDAPPPAPTPIAGRARKAAEKRSGRSAK